MAEPEKKTVMVLKVDLKCPCCYKKIQKILCRIPEIRDRVFDEKENTVTITVMCCSPEKIRDKLCSKGGKIITSIEIKEKPKSNGKENAPPPDSPDPKPPKNPAPEPPVRCRLPPVYPVNPCCGPCYHGYGFPPPPPQPCCDGNYACGFGYLYGRPACYVTRRCDYFSEENATGCRIM